MKSTHSSDVKILIVDDKPQNLLVLQAAFKNTGYVLIEALSGKEALEHGRHHDFACILLDVQMPIMDGYETAKAFRQLPATESTPIIFITAIHRSDAYEEKGYFAGAVDYLFKPINTEILVAKVAVFVDLYRKSEEIRIKNKLLEDALKSSKETEQLRLALRARDEFLMMASHELKTPITPLSLQLETFIQLFETGAHLEVDKERLLRMLHTSQAQVTRLSRLIYELVDVSKLTSHKLELNLGDVDLAELVRKVLRDFEPEIKKSGSSINFISDDTLKGNWDSFRIEQVVVNLLTNAIKYGEGNPISIKVSRRSPRSAYFEITDKGIGISGENQSRIFNRFERAVSGNHYSGLGLGLYICREIISLHRGSIRVESSEGQGSTFSFELPLQS